MAELESLAQLQALDTDLDKRRARLAEVKTALADSTAVAAARRAFDAARQKLHDDEARQRQLEWDVEERTNKIKELEGRLYSGKIGNPKELSSLQTEIQHMRVDLGVAEEKALDAISTTDEQRATTATRERDLAAAEASGADAQTHLRDEQTALDAAIKTLEAKRTPLTAGLAAPTLTKYEELRRTRHGLAVARIERNNCLGCRTTLATSQVQSARQGNIAFCSSCGRILYFAR
jgi:predicted  nucleic acid-binding Zn-ribbon protein